MANAILNVGQTGGQVNISTATAPATPSVGVVTLYAGTDKALHALNSDGVDITIAAAAASPIEVVNTTTLVSEGIGASAGSAADSIVLGNAATSNFNNTVVIGKTVAAKKIGDIAVGSNIATPATSAQCSVYVGNCITPGGNCSGAGVLGQVLVGFKVSQNQANENVGGSVLVGHCITNNHQNGVGSDGDTIVGICSTTACSRGNNAIFGRNHTAGGSSNTVVGYNNSYTATDSLSHYYNVLLGVSNTLGASTIGSVVIGTSSNGTNNCTIAIGYAACSIQARAISIGSSAAACSDGTIAIGNQARVCQNPYEHGAIAIGSCAQANGIFSTVIGFRACTTGGHDQVVIGRVACAGDAGTALGDSARASGLASTALGYSSNAAACYSVAIGGSSSATHAYAVALGSGITTERANTTHVDSLIAYGQAASKTHAIGSTGGTVTVDFNNGNVQTLSLTSSIATLTKSNPINGGVYTFQITQAGTGSYTIAWGADVKWPGGTAPTLSTAVGAVDYVTLVYTGTNYYGNANLNFS